MQVVRVYRDLYEFIYKLKILDRELIARKISDKQINTDTLNHRSKFGGIYSQ